MHSEDQRSSSGLAQITLFILYMVGLYTPPPLPFFFPTLQNNRIPAAFATDLDLILKYFLGNALLSRSGCPSTAYPSVSTS